MEMLPKSTLRRKKQKKKKHEKRTYTESTKAKSFYRLSQ